MTGYAIAFAPYLPLWSLLALIGVTLTLFGWLMLRGIPGSIFRAGLAALLILALANPSLLEERRAANPDIALLIVDETPSQQAIGRIEQTLAAATEIEDRLSRLAPELEVRRVPLRHDSLQDGAEGTRVMRAARAALADVPARRYAGAILITDGQIHDTGGLGELPPGPLHALIAGERDTPDRRLVIVEAPSFGVVDEPLQLTLRIEDPLAGPGETIRPQLLVDGSSQRIDRLPFNQDVTVTLSLNHRGPSIVDLSVPELPGELSLVNNRAVLSINGVRDRLRVLLVSGEPHPGERTWRNLLKSDPSVDLVHFTILRPPEKQDGTPIDELSLIAFPTRELFEVKLNDFDLIVFDSYRRRGVLPSIYFDNIVDYVENGGALLDAAGSGFAGPFSLFRSPLGDILPLEPTGDISELPFKPELAERGRRHPVTAGLPDGPDRLPGASGARSSGAIWGDWLRQIDVVQRSGEVIMTGIDGQPLLILDRVGEGRVAQFSSDHIWLWARGYDGGGPHAELLRRLAHWLMKEPELEEEDLKAVADDERLEVRLRTLDDRTDPPVARVTQPDGTVVDLTLERLSDGLFAGEMLLTQSGLFEIAEGGRTVRTAAGVLNSLEFSDLVASDALLRDPVAASGGRIAWLADGELPAFRRVEPGRPTGGSGWIGLTRNGDYSVVGLDTAPLLPGWLLFLAAAVLLGLGWHREAR